MFECDTRQKFLFFSFYFLFFFFFCFANRFRTCTGTRKRASKYDNGAMFRAMFRSNETRARLRSLRTRVHFGRRVEEKNDRASKSSVEAKKRKF